MIELVQADAARLPFADRSVDLVFGSPPYCDARTYGIGAQRECAEWVEWMLLVTTEAMRVSRGTAVWVAAGVTRDRNYQPACEGLMWEWWKRGGECQLYRPCYWHRVGIPGSGGDDWFRADVETVMCFKRPWKLPWSDNTAMGHPPKYAPGGEMSNRLTGGTRVNQWGPMGGKNSRARRRGGMRAEEPNQNSERPSHKWGIGGTMSETRNGDVARVPKRVNRNQRNGDGEREVGSDEIQNYTPPVLANPGNLIHTNVGGGVLGHKLAHANEAPFPVALANHFVRSLCPPGGITLDPFCGSGTTGQACMESGRSFIGSDIRESQIKLSRRRLGTVTPQLIVNDQGDSNVRFLA